MDVRTRTLAAFDRRFGSRPRWLVRAPGRVNLLGAHVDYVEGWVLPGAIDRAVWLAARPAAGEAGVVEALDLEAVAELAPDRLPGPTAARQAPRSSWLDLPRGVAWVLREHVGEVPALDVVFGSDLPIGAGLSSSAAVEVAFSLAWEAASGHELDGAERARLCRRVENEYLGVASGIMDQFASIHGRAGQLCLLDCRTLEYEHVPLPQGIAVVVADTGIRRVLADSDYNARPDECRQAAELLRDVLPQVRTLRDVGEGDLERHGQLLPEALLLRARHAVGECRRVREGAAMLARGDLAGFGAAMRASHESSRDLYQVSIPELDALAEAAWSAPGCHGARLAGAGFGGCVIALVDEQTVEAVEDLLRRAFEGRFERPCVTHPCRIADGAEIESAQ